MRSPFRRRGVHLVDDVGLVGCPREGCDVPVERCLRCHEQLEVRRDARGAVTEIRCRASDRQLRRAYPVPGPLVGPRA